MERVLREEFPADRLVEGLLSGAGHKTMRRKLDAAFIRAEEHMEDLMHRRVRTDPLVFVFPSDHRLASHAAVAPQEEAPMRLVFSSKSAPAVRRVVLEYFI